MPSKEIRNYVKGIKELEAKAKEEIDAIIDNVDIKEIIDNPQDALEQVAEVIRDHILDSYFEQAARLGISFGKKIKQYAIKDKEIVIQVGSEEAKEKAFDKVEAI